MRAQLSSVKCDRASVVGELPPAARSSSARSRCPPARRSVGACSGLKIDGMIFQRFGCRLRRRLVPYRAFDEDSVDIPPLNDWDGSEGTSGYMMSSSDGEDSDSELILTASSDVDLPKYKVSTNDALTITAHRFALIGRRRKKRRIKYGMLNNMGLITFLTTFLLLLDWCAWRIVRLPLPQFYLTRPFFMSAVIASCVGYIFVPLLDGFNIYQIIRKEGTVRHYLKKRTPTMGGLFFVPVGVAVAQAIAGFSSTEVTAATVATLAFAAIGFIDDNFSLLENRNHGLSAWAKLLLEVVVATSFALWLDCTRISSPYGMKKLVPLPAPLGIVCLGKSYSLLTSFCFVSMGNGIDLTDGLDGLAGGVSALAFIAMSVVVLPICADLAIFGASMAGACVGFLLHNRYKASVFMGDTGSLALGGALAAMAACTGMFLPLFISSGVFVVEAFSVVLQVSHFKATKCLRGYENRIFQMAPLHHHLELYGFKKPIIVAGAYLLSSVLSLFAGYVGLISA
ncbi:phospho-N-acetylmuramoyl-pentapeptide-transferase homolog [Rhodamnia argentea]|uniref:Phospho-N-acetylmuramoyl-pentapeptide- transferase homolog n=1 Tax=Rhodamnia argentea TaxID=178133 RepID=A0ABM3HXV0_9MYRT|nr:phospho-N-acetylmuramoyl-pentapeptide-transferase homolog [Rhodamnia argentea]XP_048141417.1 phospho-N-acetylmuramoyl-pentapeptide-transferase homolog [Rhodamnia argentea]